MKQLFLEVKDYILKNRVKLLSYSLVITMSLSIFLTCRKIKLPYVINKTVKVENVEVMKSIYFINLRTIDKSLKLSDYFPYQPNTYFNDQIYWKSYITFVKSTDTEAGFYMITNFPMPQNIKMSLYYIILTDTNFGHEKDYIPMIYPIFSVNDPLKKLEF
jgi:hypothetical protein